MNYNSGDQQALIQSLSNYPIFSSRLKNISRENEIITIEGVCNLPLSVDEIINGLNITNMPIKILFSFSSHGEEPYVAGYIIHSYIFTNDGYNTIVTKNYANMQYANENGNRFDSTIVEAVNLHNISPRYKSIYVNSEIPSLINEFTRSASISNLVDIITAYKIYNNRLPCVKFSSQYAKIAVRKYFLNNIKILQDYSLTDLLDIYLYGNAILLDINIPPEFATPRTSYTYQSEYFHEHVEETQTMRKDLIVQILNEISLL